MKRCYLYIIMCNLLFAACGSGEDIPGTTTSTSTAVKSLPVAFDAALWTAFGTLTRTPANEMNNTSLQTKGFGVMACYTGLHGYSDSNVRPDFIYNQHVTYDNGEWTYTPVKYWPNGEGEVDGMTGSNKHYVSFMAYAPYSDEQNPDPVNKPADYCIPSFCKQGEIGNPWLTYRLHTDVTKQVDLLYAAHTNEHPILDWTKPEINTKVMFVFRHALGCVGDQVSVRLSTPLKNQVDNRVDGPITQCKVEVTGFEIDYFLTSKARLVLWNHGEANWQTILSETPTCTRHVTLVDPNNNEDVVTVYEKNESSYTERTEPWVDKGVYYIPIELANYTQTATVKLTYRVSTYNGSSWKKEFEKDGTAVIVLRDYGKAGEHIYINVWLNPMDISLTAAIAPWGDGGTVEVEGIEE